MTLPMQQIIRHLFQVETLEEVPRERLEELVGTYPSFGVGRYLLSRKLQTEDASHFSEETQKTNLYFSNPFWLQWLLQNEVGEQKSAYSRTHPPVYTPVKEPAVAEETPGLPSEPIAGEETAFDGGAIIAEQSVIEEKAAIEEVPVVEESVLEESIVEEPVVEVPVVKEPIVEKPVVKESAVEAVPVMEDVTISETEPTIEAETALIATPEETLAATDVPAGPEKPEMTNGPVIVEEPGAAEELPPAPLSAAESLLQSLAEARELRQSLVQMNQVDDQTIPIPEESPEELIDEELAPDYEPADFEKAREAIAGRIAAAASEVSFTQPSAASQAPVLPSFESASVLPVIQPEISSASFVVPSKVTSEEVTASGSQSAPEEVSAGQSAPGEVAASTGQSASGGSVSSSPEAPAAIVSHAMALSEPIVMFEPYHTIDYFASVGIKFVQDENPQDKLGKQLKSFTDWLKVMRKLPQKNQEIVPDVAAEHQIQAIAAHSIKGKEILTETMAEVLVKQGMREKAMEVYHKLSLLNPDKSAYFATRIEQLKID